MTISIPTKLERKMRTVISQSTPFNTINPLHTVEDDGTVLTSFELVFDDSFVEVIRLQSPSYKKDTIMMVGDYMADGDYKDWPTIVKQVLSRVQTRK